MAINSNLILAKNIKIDKKNVCRYVGTDLLVLMRNQNHLIYEGSSYSFIQKNRIYVSASYEDCLYANYLAFCNPRYSDKYFFAWITKVIYTNDGTCEIEYEIDSWSTWYAHLTFKPCFVIREHVNDDTIGKHTLDENLNVGKVYAESIRVQDWSNYAYVGVLSNYIPGIIASYTYTGVSMYNKTCFGSQLLIFPVSTSSSFGELNAFLKRANNDGMIENVHDMFWIPYNAIDPSQLQLVQFPVETATDVHSLYTLPYSDNPYESNISYSKPLTFDNYSPKNNKLKCYPFNYLYVTNNNGSQNILKIEDFSGNNIQFKEMFSIAIGGSGELIPVNYKGNPLNIDESIPLGKLPTIQWSADSFTNWLTQNAVNEKNELIRYGINQASNMMNLNIGGAVQSASELILQKEERFYKASLLPEKVSGTATGDIKFSSGNTNYEIHRMRPTIEYLKIADDFLSRFGYKVNELKVPNISGRANWNYVEIGEGEICAYANGNNQNGQVPQVDLDIINSQLRGGLTIWSNPENIGNFNLSNGIV